MAKLTIVTVGLLALVSVLLMLATTVDGRKSLPPEARKINGVAVTTHAPELSSDEEEEDNKDMEIDVALDAILSLPEKVVPKVIKAGLKVLNKYSKQLEPILRKALDLVKAVEKPAVELVTDFVKNVQKLLGKATGAAAKVKTAVLKELKPVITFLEKGTSALSKLVDGAVTKLTKAANAMIDQVSAFGKFLLGGLNKIVKLVQESFVFRLTHTAGVIMDIVTKIAKWVKGGHKLLTDAMENLLGELSGKTVKFLDALRGLITYAAKEVSPLLSHFVNLVGTVGSVLGAPLNAILNSIFKVVNGLISRRR